MGLSEGAISSTVDRLFNLKEPEGFRDAKRSVEGWLEDATKFKPKPKNPIMMFQSGVGQDEERFYTDDADLLIKDPANIIGESFEFAIVCGLNIKWTMITKLNRKSLRGISCLGGGVIYQITYREVYLNGNSDVTVGFVGVKGRKFYPCNLNGYKISCTKEDCESFVIACSLAEDSNRANSFMINFNKGSNKFRVPADKEEVKNLLTLRDSPKSDSGRLRPILHMVSRHKRGKLTVNEYKRGLTNLVFCGYEISIKDHEKIANEL